MKAIDQKSSIRARPKSIGMYVAYILSQGTYLCLHLSIVTFFFPQTTNKMTKYPLSKTSDSLAARKLL